MNENIKQYTLMQEGERENQLLIRNFTIFDNY